MNRARPSALPCFASLPPGKTILPEEGYNMYLIMVGSATVAWYTFNLARLQWQRQNRAGAALTAGLALTTFLFPTLLALLRS